MTERNKAARDRASDVPTTVLQRARSCAGFVEWREALPSFELDGEQLYLPTGDVPMGEEELADSWLRDEGGAGPDP